MIDNQDGRRNQTPFVRVEMQLKKKAALEKKAKARQLRKPLDSVPENSPEQKSKDTRDELAITAKVGSNTVSTVERILATVPEPEILSAVRAGDVSINLVAQLVALPEAAQQEALSAITAQHEPAKEVMREAVKKPHVGNSTGNNEWYTPEKCVEMARTVMGWICAKIRKSVTRIKKMAFTLLINNA